MNLITYRRKDGALIDMPDYIDDYVDDSWKVKDGSNLFNKSNPTNYGIPEYEDINIGATGKVAPNFSRFWKYQKWRGNKNKFAITRR